jgi:1-acyl-sn-glycerol-3-phosphate acyltransferase
MIQRPNPLPRLCRWRSNLLQAPIFFSMTAVWGSIALLLSLFDRSGRMQHRVARLWADTCLLCSWSSLRIEGAENLRQYPVAVYASNHTSYMDTPVIFVALPFQFRILARKQLWQLPFIGWFLNRSGQMPINTENPSATRSSLGEAVKVLRGGMPLFVFPEGRRTLSGDLNPFLSGAAYLAIRAQVPLVPIALTGVYDLLPMHTHHFYPSRLTLRAGKPIETHGLSIRQTAELNDRLRAAIEELLAASPAS